MTEDKALIKKDLVLILKLDSKLNYEDIGEVKQVHAAAVNRKLFSTSVGQRYLNKLNQIINGIGKEECLFCGGTTNTDSVVCASCLNKLKGSSINSTQKKPAESNVNKEMQNKVEQKTTESAVEDANKQKEIRSKDDIVKNADKMKQAVIGAVNTQQLIENTKNIIKTAEEKTHIIAENISKNEDYQKAKEHAKNIAKDAQKNIRKNVDSVSENKHVNSLLNKINTFWKARNKKQKLIIVAVATILLIACVGGIADQGNSTGTGAVGNQKEAYKVVNSEYPEKDGWTISEGTTTKVPQGWFWTPIGKTKDYMASEVVDSQDEEKVKDFYVQIECWTFNVHCKGPTRVQGGQIIVNSEGKMMCMGVFDGVPLSDTFFRIR
ncbi:MAG: hypothetical protein ACFWTJ_15535 [Lachnoclostridium sp.]